MHILILLRNEPLHRNPHNVRSFVLLCVWVKFSGLSTNIPFIFALNTKIRPYTIAMVACYLRIIFKRKTTYIWCMIVLWCMIARCSILQQIRGVWVEFVGGNMFQTLGYLNAIEIWNVATRSYVCDCLQRGKCKR